MVATFNGWDELPEPEREELEQWERQSESGPAAPEPAPSFPPGSNAPTSS